MSNSRSPKKLRWKPPPPPVPPSPKILHFPIGRRIRRTKRMTRHPQRSPMYVSKCLPLSFGKRGFDRKDDERELLESSGDEHVEQRERVAVEDVERRVMRTECSFMTMERHFALKRLEKNGVKLERTLRSTVETIYNQSRLDKLGKVSYQQQLQESRLCKPNAAKFSDVADKNSQQRMDEFCRRVYPVLSKRIEATECSSDRPTFQDVFRPENECSGHCRALVRRIVEQVRGETEQWSQIQGIVTKVKTEIEQLQQSHDYWENRADASSREAHFLRLIVDQWREKAVFHENEVKRLQLELQLLKEKLLSATDTQAKQHQVVKKKKKKNVADKVKRNKENQEALRSNKEMTGVVHETSMENIPVRRMAFKDIGNRKSLY